MELQYSDHALKRMRQRAITELEIIHILTYPLYIQKLSEGKKIAVAELKDRLIKIVFVETERNIRIVTVM